MVDGFKDGNFLLDKDLERLRIEVYEKFFEIFLNDVEKVLVVLDKYCDEINIELLI